MVIFNWPKPQEGQNGHNVVQVTDTEKYSQYIIKSIANNLLFMVSIFWFREGVKITVFSRLSSK